MWAYMYTRSCRWKGRFLFKCESPRVIQSRVWLRVAFTCVSQFVIKFMRFLPLSIVICNWEEDCSYTYIISKSSNVIALCGQFVLYSWACRLPLPWFSSASTGCASCSTATSAFQSSPEISAFQTWSCKGRLLEQSSHFFSEPPLLLWTRGGGGGVVKTIAVGYILRRLVAMSCCLGQLHKLDFRNAFNCVHMEKTLEAVEGLVPTVHRSSEVLTQTANNFATRAGTGLKLEPFKSSH